MPRRGTESKEGSRGDFNCRNKGYMTEVLIQRGPGGLLGHQVEVWVGGFQVERTTEKEARRQEIWGMFEEQLAEWLGCSFGEQGGRMNWDPLLEAVYTFFGEQ